jgi:hypothetical protein
MIDWWSKKLSSCFPLPSNTDINSSLNINFGLNKHNLIYNTNYFFHDLVLNKLIFEKMKKSMSMRKKK